MATFENKLCVRTIVATAGISQYTRVDLASEVNTSLYEFLTQEPIAKIHSTETKTHSVQKEGGKWFLVCTVTIVYEASEITGTPFGIAKFHARLEYRCEEHGLQVRWWQGRAVASIMPDAYFSITDPQKEGKNTHHFFLEVERQKPRPSMIERAEAYYNFYDGDQCEEQFGFRTFRVVFVLDNEAKRDDFLRRLAERYQHRMFWVGVKSSLKEFRTPKGDILSFTSL
jgi:hypothetical protein